MEPERRIEKLLRAFGKKRREQAGDPMELRPSARQRLQNEIARRSTAKSGGGFFANFFFRFRPRLAFALSLIVIVAIGGWLLLPLLREHKPAMLGMENRGDQKMASAKQAETLSAPPPSVAPVASPMVVAPQPVTTAPAVTMDEDKGVSENGRRAASENNALKSARSTVTVAGKEPLLLKTDAFQNRVTVTNSMAGATVASTTPAERQPLAFKTEAANFDASVNITVPANNSLDDGAQPNSAPVLADGFGGGATMAASEKDTVKKIASQKQATLAATTNASFYRLVKNEADAMAPAAPQFFNHVEMPAARTRAAGASGLRTPVLSTFRVEEHDGEMRVVDGDGSVYIGALQVAQNEIAALTPPPAALNNKSASALSGKAPPQLAGARNYSFRVAGTNRYLNQNVIFSGNFIPLTNALFTEANGIINGDGAGNAQKATSALPVIELLSNSRISGKAVIGNQKEIEVNATPSP